MIKIPKVLTLFLFVSLAMLSSCSLRPDPRFYTEEPAEETLIAPRDEAQDVLLSEREKLLNRFKNEIRKFWQAPYKWGGDSPSGTDCSGLIVTLYKNAAFINLPHSTELLWSNGSPVRLERLVFGDLVFFNNKGGRAPDHVGMYIDKGYFLHASVSKGVTLSKLSDRPWNRVYVGARRILKE